jgi:hypothetical protein
MTAEIIRRCEYRSDPPVASAARRAAGGPPKAEPAAGAGPAARRIDFIYSRIRQWIMSGFLMPLSTQPTVPQTAPFSTKTRAEPGDLPARIYSDRRIVMRTESAICAIWEQMEFLPLTVRG